VIWFTKLAFAPAYATAHLAAIYNIFTACAVGALQDSATDVSYCGAILAPGASLHGRCCGNLDNVSGQRHNFPRLHEISERARQTPFRPGRHLMSISRRKATLDSAPQVAGNGLLDRRALLGRGIFFAGAAATGFGASATGAAAEPLTDDPWSQSAGANSVGYEARSKYEQQRVNRILSNPNGEPRTSHARTPHHLLDGTITPNGLHFTIVHSGTPDIDPDRHRLVIHGLVKQPKLFTLEMLARYPMTSITTFVECGGNSAPMFSPTPMQATVQQLHGLVSNAEWTGVRLSTLLDEVGVDPSARWFVAEGADSLALHRSVPLTKAYEDALIALYQNGERIMPGNGYPMKLILPAWQGNMNVKWLRRIQVTAGPAMSYYETRTYSQLLPNGQAYRFHFLNEVKSFITRPSHGATLKGQGYYEISGLAYSAYGRISRVMVSADGGRSWAEAALQQPVLPKAFTRFRMPWNWNGGPAVLQSRAWDEGGNVQPLRADFVARRGQTRKPPNILGFPNQHYNSITSWGVESSGEVKHVYA
jgi:sulfane dehydrogenase subunit SoxC